MTRSLPRAHFVGLVAMTAGKRIASRGIFGLVAMTAGKRIASRGIFGLVAAPASRPVGALVQVASF